VVKSLSPATRRARRTAALAGSGLAALALAVTALDRLFPPSLERLADLSTAVVDRNGAPLRLFTNREGLWRLPVTSEEVAPVYLDMLVAVEDRRFFAHPGVDPLALARALADNLAAGRVVSGASTLTMQVARLLEPRPRTLASKLVEAARALQLEARFDKRRILEMYLTLAPFGGNLEGVRAASLAYFGKEPRALTGAEAALLVALPRSPERLRPDRRTGATTAGQDRRADSSLPALRAHGDRPIAARDAEVRLRRADPTGARGPDAAERGRGRVLARAVAAGVLDARGAAEAEQESVPTARIPWPFLAPHLSERLRREDPGQPLVRTTLDGRLQQAVEALARRNAAALVDRAGLAVLVADNRASEIVAAVGAADYFDSARQGAVDMTGAVRSPGSALKPFIYGLGFDERIIEPRTLVEDVSTRFRDYSPANFDSSFHGELTVKEALLRSLNVPAVLVLDRLGPARFVDALARAGITLHLGRRGHPGLRRGYGGLGPAGPQVRGEDLNVPAEKTPVPFSSPGLPVALGGVGVTLYDLTTLYSALARDGRVTPLRVTLDAPARAGTRLLSGEAASQVRGILEEAAPAPGWVQAADRRVRGAIAVKTGTSYGYRDAWAFGVSDRYTVGVWVGRPDGTPIPEQTGRTAALPVLYQVFDLLPAPPSRAVTAPTPARPPAEMLRRLEARAPGDRRVRLPDANRLRLVFPSPGITVEVTDGAGALTPVTLIAEGGRRPLTWLVDGRPIPPDGARREVAWLPQRTGTARITVLDADGRSDGAEVSLR
jgi:penicillin-binding protein 1C